MTDLELMNGALLGVAAGTLCWLLFGAVETSFRGISPRRWRTLHAAIGAVVLVLAAWLGWRGTSTRAGLVALALLGALVLGGGLVRLRAVPAPGVGGRISWGATGLGGLIPLGVAVAGMVIGQRLSWELGGVIAALGLGGYVWMIVADVGHVNRALAALRARLRDPRTWPAPGDPELGGIDPWAEDRVRGSWDGAEIRCAPYAHGVRIEVELPEWPRGLVARTGVGGGATTGDPRFDAEVDLAGPWRGLLDVRARTALAQILSAGGKIDHEQARVVLAIGNHETQALVARTEGAVALAQALVASAGRGACVEERVLASLAHEPLAEVRLGHLTWLHEAGWELTRVLAAANLDPDEQVRAWARANALPGSGAYR